MIVFNKFLVEAANVVPPLKFDATVLSAGTNLYEPPKDGGHDNTTDS